MKTDFLKTEDPIVEKKGPFDRLKFAIHNPQSVILALLIGYFLSGIYFIGPEQQAVVTRFSRVVAKGVTPGIHFHLPWPIENITKLKVLETKRLTLGVEAPDLALGRAAREIPMQYLTGDQNIITTQIAVQYVIKDPPAYLFRSRESASIIASVVESAFTATIASKPVDSILTTGKVAVQNAMLQRAREDLDAYGIGVFINSISIENVAPPTEVATAFRDVASARSDRDRIINEALGYFNDVEAKALGEAEKLRSDADGYHYQRINEAQGDAARFTKLLAEARRAKEITEKRLYLEAMEEILPRMKKVVVDSTGQKNLMDLGIIQLGQMGQPGSQAK